VGLQTPPHGSVPSIYSTDRRLIATLQLLTRALFEWVDGARCPGITCRAWARSQSSLLWLVQLAQVKREGAAMPHPLFFGLALGTREVLERPRGLVEGLPQLFLCVDGVAQASGLVAEHLVGCLV
jgi:hypothetical protein